MWNLKRNMFKTENETSICLNCVPHNVTIGTQIWTGCNLNVSTYRDGTVIPQVTDSTAWANLTTGAWCYHNNDPANEATYGKLYNWYAVAGIHDNDPNTPNKILAPAGYHVPSDSEWTQLTNYVQAQLPIGNPGGKMKETGFCHWNAPNTDATDSSGFTGLPGGERNVSGAFQGISNFGFWWSSTELDSTYAYSRALANVGGFVISQYNNKPIGFSVRLIQD